MPHVIKRDRYFWTIALQTVVVNIFLGGFGPSQPLLRADQGTSLTIAGLHGTAMGIASILAGFANPHLVHRFGRGRTGWIGIGVFSVGLIIFVSASAVPVTIGAALITGIGISTVINNFVTSLNAHYDKRVASVAIMQANAIASAGYVIGTLIVGTIANAYRDYWRFGMLLALPLAAFLYFVIHVPPPSAP